MALGVLFVSSSIPSIREVITMSKKNRINKLRNKYPTLKKGKAWWKSLPQIDKNAFITGFIKNKNAEEIQKKEIEFNKLKQAKI